MIRSVCFSLLAFYSCTCISAGVVEIHEIRARLYLNHSGSLSEPITNKTTLWNTIIGAGDALEPSNSTLVDVVVAGPPKSFNVSSKVILTVSNAKTGKVIFKQTRSVGVLSSTGSFSVGFLLNDTGCTPLRLVATVSGSKKVVSSTVNFACGE